MAAPGDERNAPKLRPSWTDDEPAANEVPAPVPLPASEEVPLGPDAMRTSRAGTLWYWGGMSVAVLVIVALGLVLVRPRLPWPDLRNDGPAPGSGSADPFAWFPNTTSMLGPSLDRQADMLLAGDEQGWLAPVDPQDAADQLSHELGHVTTLLGAPYLSHHDVVIEGIAEYAAFDSQPIASYDRLDALHRFLRAGWDGDIDRLFRASDDPLHRSAVDATGS